MINSLVTEPRFSYGAPMTTEPLTLSSYPQAILHIDADAFFAAVEQALCPSLKGKPIVTGLERGIIACANYEAKAFGVTRGLPLREAKKKCPQLVVLPSDYETYSIFSKRMFGIMRRYSPLVEEYSVDEAFVDITGARRMFRCSYEDIGRRIQAEIADSLGITVSVGLSLSKSLAKLCSKFRKPRGFTAVPGRYMHLLLERTPLETVWGFGNSTQHLLRARGVHNAYDYVMRPQAWANKLLGKPGREIWSELRGDSVWPVTDEEKTTFDSMMKSKTFTPASNDPDLVYAKLLRNAESVFKKARRYELRARTLSVVLRRSDFIHVGLEAKLNRATSSHLEAMPLIRSLFDEVFNPQYTYRASIIVLGKLESDATEQYELFQDRLKIESMRRATRAMDAINKKYGKHTVCSATSLYLDRKPVMERDKPPERKQHLLRGESQRRRLPLPRPEITV